MIVKLGGIVSSIGGCVDLDAHDVLAIPGKVVDYNGLLHVWINISIPQVLERIENIDYGKQQYWLKSIDCCSKLCSWKTFVSYVVGVPIKIILIEKSS